MKVNGRFKTSDVTVREHFLNGAVEMPLKLLLYIPRKRLNDESASGILLRYK